MRVIPLLLLAACGPELAISIDGEVDSDGTIDLGETRRHRIETGATVTLSNAGSGTLTIDAIRLPEGISLARPELPIDLKGDEVATIRLGLIALQTGSFEGEVVLEGDDPHSLGVRGEVAPYIQLDPIEDAGLDASFDAALRADGAVGAAAAIVEGQDIVWIRGFGHADREADLEVDPLVHRFRWASLSKGLVALTVADAVRTGEISFDDPVEELILEYDTPASFLPEDCRREDCAEPVPAAAPALTVRHLLSHTGGIQHYSNGVSNPEPPASLRNDPDINTGMKWALPLFWDSPLVAPPGEAYSYSTFGYNLAGVALEDALDQDLADAVDERIAEPLGMHSLGADLHWDPLPDRVAHYRMSDGEVVRDGDSDVSWKLAGGGFTSTVADLARYCGGLLGDVVVDPRLRDEELWSPQPPALSYGLGFGVGGGPGARVISHTGAQQGTRTAIRILPDEGRCYVFMTNSTWIDPSSYTRLLHDNAR